MLKTVLLAACLATLAATPWDALPPTPRLPPGIASRRVHVGGADIWVGTIGAGPPVVLLHGGLGSSDWWGGQVPALAAGHTVVLVDSRGQGRSSLGDATLTYGRMGDDVVAAMDALGVARADFVGWSDGAIVALDLAVRRPERVGRVVAFAANVRADGLTAVTGAHSAFAEYVARAPADFRRLSPTPGAFAVNKAAVQRMWSHGPEWPDTRLAAIRAPVLVLWAEHDEAIRASHAGGIARAIPGARLRELRGVSHFAMAQDVGGFNAAVLDFLGW